MTTMKPEHSARTLVITLVATAALAITAVAGLVNLHMASSYHDSQSYQTGYNEIGPHAWDWAHVILPPTSWAPDWTARWDLSEVQECDGAAQYWLIDWGTNHDNEPSWWDPDAVRDGCLAYLDK